MSKHALLSSAIRLAAAVWIICLLGCAGRGNFGESGPHEQGPEQLLPALPLGADPRTASTPFINQVSGLDTYKRGGNTVEIGDSLYLRPTAGTTAVAVYELDTGGLTLMSVEVRLNVSAGEPFLAISDYSALCWQIAGIGESGYNELPATAASVSPGGLIYVAVLATHASDIRIFGASITVDRPGWTIYTVDSEVGSGSDVSLFVQNGLPMMAYGSGQFDAVYFARATVPLPNNATQWVTMVVASSDLNQYGIPLGAASVAGKPAVAFFEKQEYGLNYAYADVAEPSSVVDWNIALAYDASYFLGNQIRLADCAGTPRIIFSRFSGPACLAAANSAQPGPGAWTVTEITPGGENGTRTELTTIDDLPVCCLTTDLGEGNGLHVGYATSQTPSGPADWNIVPVHNWLDAGGYSALSVQTINAQDRPVISYIEDYWHGILFVARPLVDTPSTILDWVRIPLDVNVEQTDIAVVDNRPFVIYHDVGDDNLVCAWAETPEPELLADFDFYIIQEDTATDFSSVSCAAVGTTPVIAYKDPTENNLKFGYLSE